MIYHTTTRLDKLFNRENSWKDCFSSVNFQQRNFVPFCLGDVLETCLSAQLISLALNKDESVRCEQFSLSAYHCTDGIKCCD